MNNRGRGGLGVVNVIRTSCLSELSISPRGQRVQIIKVGLFHAYKEVITMHCYTPTDVLTAQLATCQGCYAGLALSLAPPHPLTFVHVYV
jgi:hypothetical protein